MLQGSRVRAVLCHQRQVRPPRLEREGVGSCSASVRTVRAQTGHPNPSSPPTTSASCLHPGSASMTASSRKPTRRPHHGRSLALATGTGRFSCQAQMRVLASLGHAAAAFKAGDAPAAPYWRVMFFGALRDVGQAKARPLRRCHVIAPFGTGRRYSPPTASSAVACGLRHGCGPAARRAGSASVLDGLTIIRAVSPKLISPRRSCATASSVAGCPDTTWPPQFTTSSFRIN